MASPMPIYDELDVWQPWLAVGRVASLVRSGASLPLDAPVKITVLDAIAKARANVIAFVCRFCFRSIVVALLIPFQILQLREAACAPPTSLEQAWGNRSSPKNFLEKQPQNVKPFARSSSPLALLIRTSVSHGYRDNRRRHHRRRSRLLSLRIV